MDAKATSPEHWENLKRQRREWYVKNRDAVREYQKNHYAKNRDRRSSQTRKRWAERREWLDTLKTDTPCIDCGNTYHPRAMQWHHLNGEDKLFGVSQMTGKRKETILKEIEKCILICANCHAVRTWA